jgi:ubiquinone/menaquinone biosynthesis C-methylase UbiE
MTKTHWSAYWQTGALTSLPVDFKKNYDGELKSYWQDVLLKSKQPISILDVCTGNGAIALMLQELSEELNIELSMTAIDASDISPTVVSKSFPEKSKYINKIKFIGNLLVEDLATTMDQKFDLIVSQYGVEYCDTEQAAENLTELLNPQGQLIFVSHSPDTAMHEYMQHEELVYQFLEEIGLFKSFTRFGKSQLTVNSFKVKLEKCLELMKEQYDFRSLNLFRVWANTVLKLCQMRNVVLKTQRDEVKAFNIKYQHSRSRAQDMLQVTNKLLNQQDWYLTFEKHGLKLLKHDDIIYQEKHNVGHYYEFVKA